jgi:hypothetical protein
MRELQIPQVTFYRTMQKKMKKTHTDRIHSGMIPKHILRYEPKKEKIFWETSEGFRNGPK